MVRDLRTMASPELITQATAFISRWPQCIQPDLIKGIIASSCGSNTDCICKSKTFGLLVLAGTRQSCGIADANLATEMYTSMCPMLNESRQPDLIACLTITTILALVSIILRVASRRIAGTKLWWDDYFLILAMIISLGETANTAILTYNGLGKHFVTLTVTKKSTFFKCFWIFEFLYGWSTTLVKFAIVLFYLRLFKIKRGMRITLYVIGVFLLLWFLAQSIYILLECRPISAFWNFGDQHSQCNNTGESSAYSLNGASLLLDLVLFIVPIPPLWGLKRSLADRLSLIVIFLVGGLVCVAGIVRVPLFVRMDLYDIPWSAVYFVIWLQIETKIGIVSACLPVLPPLLRRVSRSIRIPTFILRTQTSFRLRTPKVSGGTPLNQGSTDNSEAGTTTSDSVAANADRTVSSSSSRNKKEIKGWYSVAMTEMSTNGEDEDSQSRETLVHGKRTSSVDV